MKTVGIFFGTTGGKTQEVVDILAAQLGDAQVFDVANGVDDMGLAIDASFDTDEITSKVEDWLENKVKDELL